MQNKSYYFSHDGNARLDIKIQYLCDELGMEGYGIYWYLIESLFDAGGYLPLRMADILAKKMGASEPKVKAVILNYDLFQIIDDKFFSQRLLKHFELRKILSSSGKRGAAIKWDSPANGGANGVAIDTPMALKRKGKERKGKEIKENTIINNGKKFEYNDIVSIPSNYIQSIQEQLFTIIGKRLDESTIISMWEGFRLEKLTGTEWYANENKFYQHFVNWIKKQTFNKHKTKSDERQDLIVKFLNGK